MDITDSILRHVWFWHIIYFHEEYAEHRQAYILI